MTEKRKRGGQLKPVAERKRSNLTFRVRKDVRDKLAAIALASDRSLSDEVRHRVEASFDTEALVEMIIRKIKAVE